MRKEVKMKLQIGLPKHITISLMLQRVGVNEHKYVFNFGDIQNQRKTWKKRKSQTTFSKALSPTGFSLVAEGPC